MQLLTFLAALGSLGALATAQRYDGQFWPCNPTKNATGACPPSPGLPNSTYFIDFTKTTSIPPEWTLSNWATIKFGPLGAEFTFNKRYEAPQLWTNFMMLYGKVTIEARVANGTAMISSAVLMSDTFDEIDYEFSGNNFGQARWASGVGQNNYFGKGVTGNYDRGSYFDVSNPQKTFHTYGIDWSPTALSWVVDGKIVRTHQASQSTPTGAYQYPQTPSKLQLGIWCAGDPSSNAGTRDWAGGFTDLNGGPYTMYVKSVKIENMNPAYGYNYTDQSGSFSSIELLKKPFIDGIAQPNGPDTPAAKPPIDADDDDTDGPADDADGDDDNAPSGTSVPVVPATSSSAVASSSTLTTSKAAVPTPSTSIKATPPPSTSIKATPTPSTSIKATLTPAFTSTTAKPSLTTSSTLKTTAKPTSTSKSTSTTCTTTTTTKKASTTSKVPTKTTSAAKPEPTRWLWWWGQWWWLDTKANLWRKWKKP